MMKIGMLWLDTDRKRSFDEKVQRAAEYYEDKYGRFPEICLVNSKAIGDVKKVGKLKIASARTVLPYHFWLGMAQ